MTGSPSEPVRGRFGIRSVQVGFALHTVIAVALCFFPLFDVLGFERAFVSGLLCAPIAATVCIAMIREARKLGANAPNVSRVAAEAAAIAVAMLIPTALAGTFVELIRQPCNPGEGLLFLLLTAGISCIFGAGLGALAGVMTHARIVPGALVALSLAASLFTSLYRLHAEPQIFVYNVPFGFWPGSLYDEDVSITSALLAHRALALMFGLSLIAVARALAEPQKLVISRDGVGPRTAAMAVALVLATIVLYRGGASLGFDVDRASIQAELSRHVKTDRYEIFVDPAISRSQLDRFVDDVALRYEQLEAFFGRAPKQLRVYLYRDTGQKKRLMGASRTQVAKPWSHEIHIHGFDFPHRVLKHELSHVFAAELAKGPFAVPTVLGVFPNIAVIEGVAVAADWRVQGGLTVHEWAKSMRQLGLAPDVRASLYPMGFWAVSSSRAYTMAGSFIRYLYEQHGIDRLARLYSTNDFSLAYDRSLDALATEWETFLDAMPLPEGHLLLAEHRFKQPSVFQKACAHTVAALSNEGYALLHSGDLEGAKARLDRVYEYDNFRIDVLLALAKAYADDQRFDQAGAYVDRAVDGALTTEQRAQAIGASADLAWQEGDIEAARAGFREVLALHPSDESDRLFTVKLNALERPAAVQSVLREYLLGRLGSGLALVELMDLAYANPQDAVIRYLLGRRLEAVEAYERGVGELQAVVEQGLPGEALEREAALTLGRLLLGAGRNREAAEQFAKTATAAHTEAQRLEALDWRARARQGGSPVTEE